MKNERGQIKLFRQCWISDANPCSTTAYWLYCFLIQSNFQQFLFRKVNNKHQCIWSVSVMCHFLLPEENPCTNACMHRHTQISSYMSIKLCTVRMLYLARNTTKEKCFFRQTETREIKYRSFLSTQSLELGDWIFL